MLVLALLKHAAQFRTQASHSCGSHAVLYTGCEVCVQRQLAESWLRMRRLDFEAFFRL